jgi:hypothetical protein
MHEAGRYTHVDTPLNGQAFYLCRRLEVIKTHT